MRAKLLVAFILVYLSIFAWSVFAVSNFKPIVIMRFEVYSEDPRSLFFGDYLKFSYKMADDIPRSLQGKFCETIIVKAENIDDDGIGTATFVRFDDNTTPLSEGEYALRYYLTTSALPEIAADKYYFNQTLADDFADPRFALVGINKYGDTLLLGLEKEKGIRITPLQP